MKIKILEEYEKCQMVSSYAIPDIYNLIWTLIRFGKEMNTDKATSFF